MDFFYENNELSEMIRDFSRLSIKLTRGVFMKFFSFTSLANNLAASMAICAASARRSSPSFWDKDRRCCGDNLEKQSVGWLANWKNNRKKIRFREILL